MSKLSDFVGGGGGTSELPVYINNAATGTVTLDFSQYSAFEITTAGDITLEATGLVSEARASATVIVDNASESSITDNAFERVSQGFKGYLWPYNIMYPSFESEVKDIATDSSAYGSCISSDGTKFYLMLRYSGSTERVHEFILAMPFNISTATYNGSLLVSWRNGEFVNFDGLDIEFNPEGTRLFVLDLYYRTVYQYNLTTAFDITTASYSGKSYSVQSEDHEPRSITFSNDGLNMYYGGNINNTIYQYNLTTAFEIDTASYSSKSFSIGFNPVNISITPRGNYLFVSNDSEILQYNLSKNFDINSASDAGVKYEFIKNTASSSGGVFSFSVDGCRLYVTERNDSGTTRQYVTGALFTRLNVVQYDNQLTANWRYYQ